MQYLQVLRKFKYFCNVAIMPIKQICKRIPGFVQNGIVTSQWGITQRYRAAHQLSWTAVQLWFHYTVQAAKPFGWQSIWKTFGTES